jgi:hypothetical protein
MSLKIVGLVNETSELDQIVELGIGAESQVAPQRFTSFLISLRDFYNNPILGTGGFPGKSWTAQIGASISIISGIGVLLAEFGIIGFLFFIIISFKNSLFFSEYFSYKGKYLLFLIILFISISYSLVFVPIVMIFWMFRLFEPQIINQKEIRNIIV